MNIKSMLARSVLNKTKLEMEYHIYSTQNQYFHTGLQKVQYSLVSSLGGRNWDKDINFCNQMHSELRLSN